MSSTATTTPPPVAAPTGATPDVWEVEDPQPSRVIHGEDRQFGQFSVGVSAIQFADGTIDDGSRVEAPKVFLADWMLTVPEARELAALIVERADEVDGWVTR